MLRPGPNTGPVGSFQYSFTGDALVWSDDVFTIHGFTPGDVVPSLELMLSHKHPDDRERVADVVALARATGEPFALWHRVVDARGVHKHVLSVGAGVVDEAGVVGGLTGFIVDLSDAVRDTVAVEVREAVAGVSRSRPGIDQVKGALMLSYSLDADGAFALLRRYSQVVNVKIRDLARELAAAISTGELPQPVRRALDELVDDATRVSTADEVTGQAAAD